MRHSQGLLDPFRQLFLRPPFLVEPQATVDSVDLRVVPAAVSLAAQRLKRLPEAPAGMSLDQLIQRCDDLIITHFGRFRSSV